MRRLAISLFFLLCATHALAGPLEDKTRRLFEVQGLVQNFKEMIDQGQVEARDVMRKTVGQMLVELNPTQEFRDRMSQAAERYMRNLQADRKPEDIVDVLVRNYAPNFTEEELDKLIEFYSSPVARKDSMVSKTAMQQTADYYKADNERIRTQATTVFIADLQRIARECNCPRKPRPRSS